jgi:hypothetical protein
MTISNYIDCATSLLFGFVVWSMAEIIFFTGIFFGPTRAFLAYHLPSIFFHEIFLHVYALMLLSCVTVPIGILYCYAIGAPFYKLLYGTPVWSPDWKWYSSESLNNFSVILGVFLSQAGISLIRTRL